MKVEYSEICNPILSKVTRNNVKGVRKTFLELGDETFEMKEIESEKYKTVIRKIIGHESNKRRCKKEVAYLINIKNKNNTSKASPICVSNYIKTQSPSIKRRALSPQADKTFVAIKNNTSFLNDKSLEQSTRFKLKLMKAWVCESIHSYKTLVDIKNICDFPKSDTKNGNNKALTSMMKKYTYRFLKSPNDTSNTETIFQSSQNNKEVIPKCLPDISINLNSRQIKESICDKIIFGSPFYSRKNRVHKSNFNNFDNVISEKELLEFRNQIHSQLSKGSNANKLIC